MKKNHQKLLSVLLISLHCTLSTAQEFSRHQLFAGYGFGYTNKVFSDLGNAFNIDFLQAVFSDSSDESVVMPLYLGYRYFLMKHFCMGFNLAYPLMHIEVTNMQSKAAYKQQFQAIVFLPRADAIYVNKNNFNLYSSVAVGVIIENKDEVEKGETNVAPAYHITAIGFSVGKAIGLFAEIGYGVNGVMSIGIATKIGGEKSEKEKGDEIKGAGKKDYVQPCIRL